MKMTVDEIMLRFPQDILTALSDDIEAGIPNSELIEMYIADAEKYIKSFAPDISDEQIDILVPTYVIQRLYERLGYMEKARDYKEQLDKDILLLTTKRSGDEGKGNIYSYSRERKLDPDEIQEW